MVRRHPDRRRSKASCHAWWSPRQIAHTSGFSPPVLAFGVLAFRVLAFRVLARSVRPGASSRDAKGVGNGEGRRMSDTAAIDRVLQQAVDAGEVLGVVAVAADDGGVIYQGAFG